jgi:hypothetical protein
MMEVMMDENVNTADEVRSAKSFCAMVAMPNEARMMQARSLSAMSMVCLEVDGDVGEDGGSCGDDERKEDGEGGGCE